jgi:hypothetical protein
VKAAAKTKSGALALLLGLVLLPANHALAQMAGPPPAPVYKDAERFAEPGYGYGYGSAPNLHPPGPMVVGPLSPRRPVTGGPGYAGSEYGLGKPSFNGLGSRPDWGRSNL